MAAQQFFPCADKKGSQFLTNTSRLRTAGCPQKGPDSLNAPLSFDTDDDSSSQSFTLADYGKRPPRAVGTNHPTMAAAARPRSSSHRRRSSYASYASSFSIAEGEGEADDFSPGALPQFGRLSHAQMHQRGGSANQLEASLKTDGDTNSGSSIRLTEEALRMSMELLSKEQQSPNGRQQQLVGATTNNKSAKPTTTNKSDHTKGLSGQKKQPGKKR